MRPIETTFDYIEGRPYAPKGEEWEKAVAYWRTLTTDDDAVFDRELFLDANALEPMVTYGTNPGEGIPISGRIPTAGRSRRSGDSAQPAQLAGLHGPASRANRWKASRSTSSSSARAPMAGLKICAQAAAIVKGKKVADSVWGIVVPGSKEVKSQAEQEGLDRIFQEAGFEWRGAGCSMCLAMNDDKAGAGKYVASTSNRNFRGRQGPGARSLLMSPIMAAAAAVNGRVVDVRDEMSEPVVRIGRYPHRRA